MCPSPLCLHLPCSPRLAPLHPPGLSWLLSRESHQVQADLRAFAVAVTRSQNALPPCLVAEVGFRSLVWPPPHSGLPSLPSPLPSFHPWSPFHGPLLHRKAGDSLGHKTRVTSHCVGTPSVSGTSEPHITLHPHCNPLTHGKALTFQGGQRVRPC